jgi:hypothetical protein
MKGVLTMKRILVMVLLVVVAALVGFILGQNMRMEKPLQTDFPGSEKHEISKEAAIKMIKNYKNIVKDSVSSIHGGSFDRAVIDKILAQPGCKRLRLYFAAEEKSTPTVVLVGVDEAGKDMVQGTIAERIGFCPPFCDGASELLQ